MKVYQIWWETEVGPIFLTKHGALKFLECKDEEQLKEKAEGYGYPDIEEIEVGDLNFIRDR